MPSCTIYNRSAFFQLHHNNAAWWRSEWFGDSTIGLLNFFAKKNVWKQDQIDQTLNFKTKSVTKNLYWFTLWLQQKYHFLTKTRSYFSISILLSKTFGHVVNFNCCINRVVEKLINLKLITWSFQMWLLIIWGTNWTQGFHCTGLSVDGWLPIIMARMLPKHWSCDISRYYLDNLLILLRHPLFDCLSSQHGDVRVCQ